MSNEESQQPGKYNTNIGQVQTNNFKMGDDYHYYQANNQAMKSENPDETPVATPTNTNAIFVSYSHLDWQTYVEPLVIQLRRFGFEIWVDKQRLIGGDVWMDSINAALQTCGRLILCMSPEALASKYVKIEYRYFITHNKPIYPIICREVSQLPPELASIQYLSYDVANKFENLVAALTSRNTS